MKLNKYFFILLFIFICSNLLAYDNSHVKLDNPVYGYLEYLESKSFIPIQPIVKPYTEKYIIKILRTLNSNQEIDFKERSIIKSYLQEFDSDSPGISIAYSEFPQRFESGVMLQTESSFGINENPGYSSSNIFKPYFQGNLGDNISYFTSVGIAYEKFSPDIFWDYSIENGDLVFPYSELGYSYLPYQFDYDTLWWHASLKDYSHDRSAIDSEFSWGFDYDLDFSGCFFDNILSIGFHNLRRSWGQTNNNLLLSSKARTFNGIEYILSPVEWARYSFLSGSLFEYSAEISSDDSIYSMQKMYNINTIEIQPIPEILLAFSSANIWAERYELGYMLPFVIPFFMQLEQGDQDNLAIQLEAALQLPYLGKLWGSFFIDEMDLGVLSDFFKLPRNRYAYQIGINIPISILRNTLMEMKYTKLTPFVYTHYAEIEQAQISSLVDQSFTHDGFNLGFYLPPNSDEYVISLTHYFRKDFALNFQYSLIRHGTNEYSPEEYLIYGDIDIIQDNDHLYDYPLMDFLNDGIYDISNIYECTIQYSPNEWPVRLDFSVAYSYSFIKWLDSNESNLSQGVYFTVGVST